MTGNCTRECTEFGHSDSCWMPGQPPSSPGRKAPLHSHSHTLPNPKTQAKLSTFVPYHADAESAGTLCNGSAQTAKDERGAGTLERGSKMANMRFMTPYNNSAYTTTSAAGDVTSPGAKKEPAAVPSQEYHHPSHSTAAGQTAAKREIYL
uniref:Protocadherin-9 n=1 Tax=Knipowitschia caucasica TaxID=637954 RepID=A0AAV2KDH3_KNICA